MSQRIENSSWESIVRGSTFEDALFESDECYRELRTRVGKTLCAEVRLKRRLLKVMNVLVFGRPASPRKWWRRVAPAGPKNTVFGGSKNVARVRKSIETRKLKAANLNPHWLDTRTYIIKV